VKPEPISLPMPEGSELLVNRDASARVRVQDVGDRAEQFAAFVDSIGPYLLHTAELLCGDRARAKDLVQATFERPYRSWSRRGTATPGPTLAASW
jgi:DNA-directed RNA polymerase specialized sigma24 family protein